MFMMLSLITYNSSEEPTVSPNIAISNRSGIIGVYIGHYFRKLGLGYISFFVPILGIAWGWILFSKKSQEFLLKITLHVFLIIIILSMSLGLAAINSIISYESSGLLSAIMAKLLHDFIGTSGTIIFLFASTFVVIRSYFDWNFYDSLKKFGEIFPGFIKREKLINKEENVDSLEAELNDLTSTIGNTNHQKSDNTTIKNSLFKIIC